MDTKNVKCMCGHLVEEKDVVYINPSTKAINMDRGTPLLWFMCPHRHGGIVDNEFSHAVVLV